MCFFQDGEKPDGPLETAAKPAPVVASTPPKSVSPEPMSFDPPAGGEVVIDAANSAARTGLSPCLESLSLRLGGDVGEPSPVEAKRTLVVYPTECLLHMYVRPQIFVYFIYFCSCSILFLWRCSRIGVGKGVLTTPVLRRERYGNEGWMQKDTECSRNFCGRKSGGSGGNF